MTFSSVSDLDAGLFGFAGIAVGLAIGATNRSVIGGANHAWIDAGIPIIAIDRSASIAHRRIAILVIIGTDNG